MVSPARQHQFPSLFTPQCLTISLGRQCNLDCCYCFSKGYQQSRSYLPEKELLSGVVKAAELVARNCAYKQVPFFLGFQGSGEPLMHFDTLKQIYQQVESVVGRHQLKFFGFITSNGCMEINQYEWIAARFQRVCLSLDGDKRMHDTHRRTKGGQGTYTRVIRSLGIFRDHSVTPAVRMTVTRHNVEVLLPITRHFIHDLGLCDIQVEPVYLDDTLYPDPERFAVNYLESRTYAQNHGVKLGYSGYRKHEMHGPYCNMNRNVLYIGPKGTASICLFKDLEDKQSPFVIGYYDAEIDQFILQTEKIERLQQLSAQSYRDCRGCAIADSCVKGCPDVCVLEADSCFPVRQSLRCQINQSLYQNGYERKTYS